MIINSRILLSSGKGCGSDTHISADLLFMIDGSWSVGSTFNKQLLLVNKVVNEYGGISKTGAHAGVVMITTNPSVKISLKDYTDNDAFTAAVLGVSINCIVFPSYY